MKQKQIDIFEFPTNLGLTKKAAEYEPGVNQLPTWLQKNGLYDALPIQNIFTLKPPAYETKYDVKTNMLNMEQVILYAQQQATLFGTQFSKDTFKLVLGGDCSILLGSTIALKQKGTYGLFFLDGHTDYTSTALSDTKAVAGMDLALVTGFGDDRITNIHGLAPYVKQEHVYCVGNREYDAAFVAPIKDTNIHYYDLACARSHGLATLTSDFLKHVTEHKLDGFFIHLDVDVLHNDIMPSVDSPAPDGLTYAELATILSPILHHPKAVGMEITILDPTVDKEAIYTKPFIKQIVSLLNQEDII